MLFILDLKIALLSGFVLFPSSFNLIKSFVNPSSFNCLEASNLAS